MRTELLIGGTWRPGAGARFGSVDPATGETLWQGAAAAPQDVVEAVGVARKAGEAWGRTPIEARIELVRRFAAAIEARAEALAELIAREMGKPLWDARGEVRAVVAKVEISIKARAERAGEREEMTPFGKTALAHRPHGVMAVFGPYNFPAHLPNGHIVPALLAGNAVVFKPSELTPAAGAAMVEAWVEAGAPEGVVNLVQGGRETGAALLDTAIDGVLFTGSAQTGRSIHARFAGRPEVLLALEMGGNNPLIVWPPHSPAAAANLIVQSAFVTSGQRCSCARRLILPTGPQGDATLEALAALLPQVRMAAWDAQPEPFLGPLVSVAAAARAQDAIMALTKDGARLLTPLSVDGAYFAPALLDVAAAQPPDEEIFAPVLQVLRASTLEEAIARANATRFGLAAGLVSDDAEHWAKVLAGVRAGVLNWNRPTTGASSALPFGGPGHSGNLRPSAYYAADYAAYPVAMQIASEAAAVAAPGLPD